MLVKKICIILHFISILFAKDSSENYVPRWREVALKINHSKYFFTVSIGGFVIKEILKSHQNDLILMSQSSDLELLRSCLKPCCFFSSKVNLV
jgi:hypothetical protein